MAGIVIGTAVGAGLGQGGGQVTAAIVGALAGGVAGSVAETAAHSHSGVQYTIKLDDGRVVTVIQHHDENEPIYAPGAPVGIMTRGRVQQVEGRPPV